MRRVQGDVATVDTPFRIEMLGRFSLRQGSRETTRFRTRKTASLLACLALHRSRFHPRDLLIEQFWPDSDLKSARTNLSVALNALRGQLEPPGIPAGAVLIADHTKVRLNPVAISTDVEDFQEALRKAEAGLDIEQQMCRWIEALEYYQGDLLPGFYEDWVLTERDRLQNTYRATLRQIVQAGDGSEDEERVLPYALRLVGADPLGEDSYRLLMCLCIKAGRPQDALRHYQELEERLRTELQTVPSAPLRELADQLRHLPLSRPEPRRAVESSAASRETGVFHHPAPKTAAPPHKLPVQFTRFFGREEEIQHLRECLVPSATSPGRLITLTGIGGTGKTRLSIEAAEQAKDAFPGGLWFVPLAEREDPLEIGEAIRDILDLPRQSQSAVLDQVITFLCGREAASLLVLDNFEQITAGGAPIVWTLLNRVPSLHCLVTSRQPLSLPGERVVPVSPLPVPGNGNVGLPLQGKKGGAASWGVASAMASSAAPPTPTELILYPSIALFVDRVQTVRPEFRLTAHNAGAVATICEQLEGIPLALELAAARARALTPNQILDRLTERFDLLAARRADTGERHRSLRAAIEWSFDLLPPDLQHLFARLSVFRGGWTLEAAEAVAGDSDTEQRPESARSHTILDGLAQLRGHSLIYADESTTGMRFRMLETLREFATDLLAADQRESLEKCHTRYFQQWVSDAPGSGPERIAWFGHCEEDFDNLRVALAWTLQPGNDLDSGLRMAADLIGFWQYRGHLSEGRRWVMRLLERAAPLPTVELGKCLHGAGMLAYLQGEFTAAFPLLERCMVVAQVLNEETILTSAHSTLGCIFYRQGEYPSARLHFEEALKGARNLGIQKQIAGALGNLANVAQSSGDFENARALHEESLVLWNAQGDLGGAARTLHNLANLATSQEQWAEARDFYERSLAIKRELGDRYAISATARGVAEVALGQRDFAAAAVHARECVALVLELDARSEQITALHMVAEFAQALQDWEIAAGMYGALEQAREDWKSPIEPVYQAAYTEKQIALQEALGQAKYDGLKATGKRLSLVQALGGLDTLLARHAL